MAGTDRPKITLARRMRRAPTMSERLLWKLLRNRRLEGFKFRRQVPIGKYVADFVCLRHRLIVEAGGPWHEDNPRDLERDVWLSAQGFTVLRFPNNEIVTRPENILMAVIDAVPGAAPPDTVRPLIRPR
ncbi:endonuclease domain-containing protein [Phenylobacterium sp.]|uniref:endonuclease domain-containing protein n=1 Tax=Phenylobacterium sp. TaxID=1871053 RepID=UPI002FCBB9BF